MNVCLFEEDVETLEPLIATRGAFDLRFGIGTLGESLRRTFAARSWSAWVRPGLADLVRRTHPGVAVNDRRHGAGVWLNARWRPPVGCVLPPDATGVGMLDGEIAWVVHPPEDVDWATVRERAVGMAKHPAGGTMVRHLWELVDGNGEQILRDVAESRMTPTSDASLTIIGPRDRVCVDSTARIDPFVALDATGGPIVVEAAAVVTSFSRLEGPCVIGRGTHVLGAKVRAGTTLGPFCRIGGEVEASVVQGYTNKYHEGFLGHSYVGEWVNLGAGTHTSDLRNDYGPVAVVLSGQRVESGSTKVGSLIGDHTKTGLGTLLNSGTNVGAFCNVLPSSRYAAKYMPAFTDWTNGVLREAASIESLLTIARTVMKRRGHDLTPEYAAVAQSLREETSALRSRVVHQRTVG